MFLFYFYSFLFVSLSDHLDSLPDIWPLSGAKLRSCDSGMLSPAPLFKSWPFCLGNWESNDLLTSVRAEVVWVTAVAPGAPTWEKAEVFLGSPGALQ